MLDDVADQKIVSFYIFCDIKDTADLARWHESFDLLGRIVIATEGVNGTFAGLKTETDRYELALTERLQCTTILFQGSDAKGQLFPDWKITVQNELVSTGELVTRMLRDATSERGRHVEPREFRDKMPNSIILDVRNFFEYAVGHFRGAVKAPIRTMSEWATWIKKSDILQKAQTKDILMYCTGGVRCETASRYLIALGAPRVSQLRGGIVRYLDEFPNDSVFEGRNFLFDAREAMSTNDHVVVGVCSDCHRPWDRHSGRNICSVCSSLVLVCPTCQATNHEHYCELHDYLRDVYCYFLDVFTDDASLQAQDIALDTVLRAATSTNVRRGLRKQLIRVRQRRRDLQQHCPTSYDGPPRCRSCGKAECKGFCWGFWSACASSSPPPPPTCIQVGAETSSHL